MPPSAGGRRGGNRAKVLVGALVLLLTALSGCTTSFPASAVEALSKPRDATVSGQSPARELPGYRLEFVDDFPGTALSDKWSTYSGRPGGDPYSRWRPDNVRVADGQLLLDGYRVDGAWTTGGVSNWPVTQTYGRWEVRFRAPVSDEITYHFLLWPQSDQWPPEIDFAEDFGGLRQGLSAFLHSQTDGRAAKQQRDLTGVDFTRWQTVGVEWSPGEVRYLVDGRVWERIASDAVPGEPMWLALQAQSGGCQRKADYGFPECPVAGVPDRTTIAVDWVAVYAPT